ncbi:uncharacterized protein K460DRAFT_359187 [Cucurbitaria berberidis CBS 394.84]|uniref:Uncharacterized protein n=1 Tax=Cucurbitaria berberidis CBS 394.84 TaxID=1168544 RepID=A0A9P4GB74_9PLEO|nr:uncharacterized protein K460DRAFT_359187 [Cucurbitaria berberidis CBS 394.84]KAF1842608.1 hypothetical protein K460DRAFT_359187 [Cucurbitaria berberidis CBS 394.84]
MAIAATIDIAAPPEVVRAKFLDFESLPKYHKDFFGSITPLAPSKSLAPGNKVHVVFAGAGQKMDAIILENKPEHFQWRGSIPVLFTGDHGFRFEPSTSIPGGTKFTQEEYFSGALGFMMGQNVIARQLGFAAKTVKGWEGFNQEFKAWCEKK